MEQLVEGGRLTVFVDGAARKVRKVNAARSITAPAWALEILKPCDGVTLCVICAFVLPEERPIL